MSADTRRGLVANESPASSPGSAVIVPGSTGWEAADPVLLLFDWSSAAPAKIGGFKRGFAICTVWGELGAEGAALAEAGAGPGSWPSAPLPCKGSI